MRSWCEAAGEQVVDLSAIIAADSRMAFLAPALDRAAAAPMLARCLQTAGQRVAVEVRATRVLRYKPGRRCLLEYDLELSRAGQVSRVVLLAKSRAGHDPRRPYELLKSLRLRGFTEESEDSICVPEPIGVIPELSLWLQREVRGISAAALMFDPQGPELVGRVARAAWKLQTAGVPAYSRHSIADELSILRRRLASICGSYPWLAEQIAVVLERCERVGAALPCVQHRPIHRDFHPDNLIVDGPRLYIVDLDLYSEGDPALDIGNFCAHLTESSIRRFGSPDASAVQERELEDSFAALAGEDTRISIRAYAALTLARHIQISTEFADRREFTTAIVEVCGRRLDSLIEQIKHHREVRYHGFAGRH